MGNAGPVAKSSRDSIGRYLSSTFTFSSGAIDRNGSNIDLELNRCCNATWCLITGESYNANDPPPPPTQLNAFTGLLLERLGEYPAVYAAFRPSRRKVNPAVQVYRLAKYFLSVKNSTMNTKQQIRALGRGHMRIGVTREQMDVFQDCLLLSVCQFLQLRVGDRRILNWKILLDFVISQMYFDSITFMSHFTKDPVGAITPYTTMRRNSASRSQEGSRVQSFSKIDPRPSRPADNVLIDNAPVGSLPKYLHSNNATPSGDRDAVITNSAARFSTLTALNAKIGPELQPSVPFPDPAATKIPTVVSEPKHGNEAFARKESVEAWVPSAKTVQDDDYIFTEAEEGILKNLNFSSLLADYERRRISVLRQIKILENHLNGDPQLDGFVARLAALAIAPICAINIIDMNKIYCIARINAVTTVTPRLGTFCTNTILPDSPRLFVVEDTLNDARFATMPYVVGGPQLRFYAAGAIIVNSCRIGTLCVFGRSPRNLSVQESDAIIQLADEVSNLLARRREENLKIMARMKAAIDIIQHFSDCDAVEL